MLYFLMKRFFRQLQRMIALIANGGNSFYACPRAYCRLLFSAYETASAALQRRNYAPDDLALAIPFRTYDRYVSANGNAAEFWMGADNALAPSRSRSQELPVELCQGKH